MRSPSADLIRIAATYLVIVIHAAGEGFYTYHPQWFIHNFYGALACVCVPLFFMLSGSLLLPKEESLRQLYRTRVLRVLVVLIVWSYLYLFFLPQEGTPDFSLIGIFQKPAASHIWFFYAILSLYLMLPILRVIARADRSLIVYLLALWFVWASLLPHYALLSERPLLHPELIFSAVTRYAGFFFLGFWLASFRSRQWIMAGLALYLFSSYATYALSRDWTVAHGFHPIVDFYYHLSPTVIIAAAGLFLFLQNLGAELSRRFQPALAFVSPLCLGIFLLHPFLLVWLKRAIPGWPALWPGLHPLFAIPLGSLLVFALALALVWPLRRIPLVNRLI